jgi:hypothetical protein
MRTQLLTTCKPCPAQPHLLNVGRFLHQAVLSNTGYRQPQGIKTQGDPHSTWLLLSFAPVQVSLLDAPHPVLAPLKHLVLKLAVVKS